MTAAGRRYALPLFFALFYYVLLLIYIFVLLLFYIAVLFFTFEFTNAFAYVTIIQHPHRTKLL